MFEANWSQKLVGLSFGVRSFLEWPHGEVSGVEVFTGRSVRVIQPWMVDGGSSVLDSPRAAV